MNCAVILDNTPGEQIYDIVRCVDVRIEDKHVKRDFPSIHGRNGEIVLWSKN